MVKLCEISLWERVRACPIAHAALFAFALAYLAWLPGPVSAQPAATSASQGTFSVTGRVVNGSAGSDVPEGLTVRIVAFSEASINGSAQGLTSADGSFQVNEVPVVVGASYVAAVEWQDATYLAQVDPTVSPIPPVELTIYDVVSVNPGLRFEQSVLAFSLPDDSLQALAVTEIHTVLNTSDKTFLPRSDGPGGPEGLLVFGLPPDASDLRPLRGLDPSRVVQIGRGFASLSQLTPGRTEISFSYRLPYASDSIRIDRTVRYPVDSMRLLSPAAGPRVETEQLGATNSINVVGRQYQTRDGGPFPVGTTISILLADLPLPGGILARVPPGAIAGLGVLLGLAALGLYLARVRPADEAQLPA